jgi:hypothetical protein
MHSPDRISTRALRAMRCDGVARELSSFSITEIAIKTGKGRLGIHRKDGYSSATVRPS